MVPDEEEVSADEDEVKEEVEALPKLPPPTPIKSKSSSNKKRKLASSSQQQSSSSSVVSLKKSSNKKSKTSPPTLPTVTGKGTHISTSVSHIGNYEETTKSLVKRSVGSVDLVATQSCMQIDFDSLDFDATSDKPRQTITKKKNIPRNMAFVIDELEKIDFSKDKEESKLETVVTVTPIQKKRKA